MTVNIYVERGRKRRHLLEYLEYWKKKGVKILRPKTPVIGRRSLMRLNFKPEIKGKGSVGAPPDVPFLKLPGANVVLYRLGYCTFCGEPIFGKDKAGVGHFSRCWRHDNDSTKWTKWSSGDTPKANRPLTPRPKT